MKDLKLFDNRFIRRLKFKYLTIRKLFPGFIDNRESLYLINNVYYISINKNFSSTVKSSILLFLKGELNKTVSVDYFFNRHFLIKRNSKLNFQNKAFMFTRNPYIRILSAYIHIYEGSKNFEEFLSFLHDNPSEILIERHYLPQYLFDIDNLDIQYLKVENFLTNFNKVKSILNLNLELIVNNKHKTGSSNLISKYYTDRSKKLVDILYEEDFRRFDYIKELPKNEN